MAEFSIAKDKEAVASYSCICYYFSIELFLLVSGNCASSSSCGVGPGWDASCSNCDPHLFLAHYQFYLPDSGSKLVINAEVAPEDCGYRTCRRGRE